MNKDRQIVSELRNFFTENGCGLGIQHLVAAVADFFSTDIDELLTNIITENKQLNAIMRVARQLQPAA